MGTFAAGQVVTLRYPFSDLSGSKHRPGVIIASSEREDWLVCQITSNPFSDKASIALNDSDFVAGSLSRMSYARPGKLFTAHESLISAHLGSLKPEVFASIRDAIIQIMLRQ